MKHEVRSRIFQILSLLPERIGDFIYHKIQSQGEGANVLKKVGTISSAFELITRILREHNIELKNKNLLEIGSGWVPIFPYLMILKAKVQNVKTYDINEHYNKIQIAEVNDYYCNYNGFKISESCKYKLLENVEYYPKQNITDADFSDIDFVFSRYVLEHVTTESLEEMHSQFAKKLKSGSYILHLISPSDHRAYTDSSLSLQDFLKYSQSEWDSIQTRFDYHNRLRLPQYLDIFSKDFEIISLEYDKINFESIAYKNFKKLKIHKDFQKYTEQELMAGSINILLRKK